VFKNILLTISLVLIAEAIDLVHWNTNSATPPAVDLYGSYVLGSHALNTSGTSIYVRKGDVHADWSKGYSDINASSVCYSIKYPNGTSTVGFRELECYAFELLTCQLDGENVKHTCTWPGDVGNPGTVSHNYYLRGDVLRDHNNTSDVKICAELVPSGDTRTNQADRIMCTNSNISTLTVRRNEKADVKYAPHNDKGRYIEYNRTSNKKVVAYYGNWSGYDSIINRAIRPLDTNVSNYTHIVHSFLGICSSDARNELNTKWNEAKRDLGPEFENAYRFYNSKICNPDTSSGTTVNDGEIKMSDEWATKDANFGYVKTLADGTEVKGLMAQYIEAKDRNQNLKIVFSIGGWTLSHAFKYIAGNALKQNAFITSINNFLDTYPFIDGIDIDWEYPKSKAEGEQYELLIKALRVSFDARVSNNKKRIELSSAVFSTYDEINDINYTEVSKSLDYIFGMTYDYHGAATDEIGFHTNLRSKLEQRDLNASSRENSLERAYDHFIAAGVPADKLLLGVASYGRSIKLGAKSDITNGRTLTGVSTYGIDIDYNSTDRNYSERMERILDRGYVGSFEKGTIEFHDFFNRFWYPGNPNLNYTVEPLTINGIEIMAKRVNGFFHITDPTRDADYFYNPDMSAIFDIETPRTAYNKSKFALEHNLSGVFFWSLDYDNGLIINAINRGLGHTVISGDDLTKFPRGFDMEAQTSDAAKGSIFPASKKSALKYDYNTTTDEKIVGFIGSWSVYNKNFDPNQIIFSNYSHIVHAYLGICSQALIDANETDGNKFNFYKTKCDNSSKDGYIVETDPYAATQIRLGSHFEINGTSYFGLYALYKEAKVKNPRLKILASIGGATWSKAFTDIVNDTTVKDNFIQSIKDFLGKYTFFDGIDIAWEFSKDVNGSKYVALLKDLRDNIDTNKIITSSVMVDNDKKGIVNYGEAIGYLDLLFAMTYDFHGDWKQEIGFHANLNHISDDNDSLSLALTRLMEDGNLSANYKNKILLGIGTYGKPIHYKSKDDITSLSPLKGFNSYVDLADRQDTDVYGSIDRHSVDWNSDVMTKLWSQIILNKSTTEQFELNGKFYSVKQYSIDTNRTLFYFTDDERNADFFIDQNKQIFFDMETPRTVVKKTEFVEDQGLAGVFTWSLGQDNGTLENAIHEGFKHTVSSEQDVSSIVDNIDMDNQIAIKGTVITLPKPFDENGSEICFYSRIDYLGKETCYDINISRGQSIPISDVGAYKSFKIPNRYDLITYTQSGTLKGNPTFYKINSNLINNIAFFQITDNRIFQEDGNSICVYDQTEYLGIEKCFSANQDSNINIYPTKSLRVPDDKNITFYSNDNYLNEIISYSTSNVSAISNNALNIAKSLKINNNQVANIPRVDSESSEKVCFYTKKYYAGIKKCYPTTIRNNNWIPIFNTVIKIDKSVDGLFKSLRLFGQNITVKTSVDQNSSFTNSIDYDADQDDIADNKIRSFKFISR